MAAPWLPREALEGALLQVHIEGQDGALADLPGIAFQFADDAAHSVHLDPAGAARSTQRQVVLAFHPRLADARVRQTQERVVGHIA